MLTQSPPPPLLDYSGGTQELGIPQPHGLTPTSRACIDLVFSKADHIPAARLNPEGGPGTACAVEAPSKHWADAAGWGAGNRGFQLRPGGLE